MMSRGLPNKYLLRDVSRGAQRGTCAFSTKFPRFHFLPQLALQLTIYIDAKIAKKKFGDLGNENNAKDIRAND